MARKLDFERLHATERGRRGEPSSPRPRNPDREPYRGHLTHPPKAARAFWLRRCHAHLEAPSPARPYFTVRAENNAFLGAGKTAERAVWNAMQRTRHRHHDAP
jgi:hypothetical protein